MRKHAKPNKAARLANSIKPLRDTSFLYNPEQTSVRKPSPEDLARGRARRKIDAMCDCINLGEELMEVWE